MSQLASPAQLRMSLVRWALFVVPTIMLLGFLSGIVSGSGEQNGWFAELVKPGMQPPGWLCALIWPMLYFLMGIAISIILNAHGARLRGAAAALFMLQLALNLYWSPLFFGQHQVSAAFYLLLAIWAAAFAATLLFARIRPIAAWLMVPYLVWIGFAAILNHQIDRLNPDAERLYIPAATADTGA